MDWINQSVKSFQLSFVNYISNINYMLPYWLSNSQIIKHMYISLDENIQSVYKITSPFLLQFVEKIPFF